MTELSPGAKAARAAAAKKYREAHREEINAYRRQYYQANKEKLKEQTARYWERKAAQGGISAEG